MDLNEDGVFSILSHNSLENKLKMISEFYDKKMTYLKGKGYIISEEILGVRLHYKIHQYKNLIDSSDCDLEFIIGILGVIKNNFDDYDGFIVIHGTDSMEYSATAISFLIKNLKKTIVFTGS